MEKQYDGVWELRLPDSLFHREKDGFLPTYKYAIECADGEWRLRADPYAFESELRPNTALYSIDDGWDGFQWLNVNDAERSIAAFLRSDGKGNALAVVTNFTPQPYGEYRVALPYDCELEELLNSDRSEFAGSGQYNPGPIRAEHIPQNGLDWSCVLCVPPLSTVFFEVRRAEN